MEDCPCIIPLASFGELSLLSEFTFTISKPIESQLKVAMMANLTQEAEGANVGIGNENNNNNRRRGNNNHNNNGGRGGVYAVFLIVAVMFLLSESGLRYFH